MADVIGTTAAVAGAAATTSITILGYTVDIFWIGVLGAFAVEVAAFAAYYDSDNHPVKYKRTGFYLSKLILAMVGGVLVTVYGVTTAPAALQIGASASALVLALSKKEPPPASIPTSATTPVV